MTAGRFTDAGLALLASYEQSPANKRPFSKMKIGDLTDADYDNENLYDGSETDLHGTATQLVESVETIVDPNDASHTTARVKATIIPAAAVKGQTIREIGLFVTDANNHDVLVWIGKFPPTYIPSVSEPDMQTDLVITIPIKFNSAASIAVNTNSANFALKTELDEVADELDEAEAEIAEMKAGFMPVRLEYQPQLSNKILRHENVFFCAVYDSNGNTVQYNNQSEYDTNMALKPTLSELGAIYHGDHEYGFDELGRLNFMSRDFDLSAIPHWSRFLKIDYMPGVTSMAQSVPGAVAFTGSQDSYVSPNAQNRVFVVILDQEMQKFYFLISCSHRYPNGATNTGLLPKLGSGFYIPLKK